MKKTKFIKYEIFSALGIMIVGTILHFAYSWSNNNPLVSLFSSVNESVWEHLKILFYSYLLFTLVGTLIFRNKSYFSNKTIAIYKSLGFIITFYYTYSGIIGQSVPIIDILSFYLAIIIGQISSYKKREIYNFKLIIALLIVTSLAFTIFTFYPLEIGIFISP
ncbi:MAG: hypothetical protein E7164_00725 [Firmicutes bacterium]|nr:hypothetical protein [Bacillota bacterium]